jgi:hypothetical protein
MLHKKYYELPGFSDVYLEDSYVLGIAKEPTKLTFLLDLVLRESHPLYTTPQNGQQYCYYPANLEFPNVERLRWVKQHLHSTTDAEGNLDYGNIDALDYINGYYHVEGDWGIVEVQSDPPLIRLHSPQ